MARDGLPSSASLFSKNCSLVFPSPSWAEICPAAKLARQRPAVASSAVQQNAPANQMDQPGPKGNAARPVHALDSLAGLARSARGLAGYNLGPGRRSGLLPVPAWAESGLDDFSHPFKIDGYA